MRFNTGNAKDTRRKFVLVPTRKLWKLHEPDGKSDFNHTSTSTKRDRESSQKDASVKD